MKEKHITAKDLIYSDKFYNEDYVKKLEKENEELKSLAFFDSCSLITWKDYFTHFNKELISKIEKRIAYLESQCNNFDSWLKIYGHNEPKATKNLNEGKSLMDSLISENKNILNHLKGEEK